MTPAVLLSTACFFPNTELGFRMAAELGYEGVEVMVTTDRRSQSVESVAQLVAAYDVPVRAVHVPCLVITQHVWGWNPEAKLKRAVAMAMALEAEVVVVHPPFRWQRDYTAGFSGLVGDVHREARGAVTVAVENMYTVPALGRNIRPYEGIDDEDFDGYPAMTLDTSHAAADRRDVLELYDRFRGRIRHVHLSDSTVTKGDEHLPPGAGRLPLAELARTLVTDGFDGHVVIEVGIGRLPEGTRTQATAECREWALEALARH